MLHVYEFQNMTIQSLDVSRGARSSVNPDEFDPEDGISLPKIGYVTAKIEVPGEEPVTFPVFLDKSVRVGQIASDAYFVLVGLANLVSRAATVHVSIDENSGITVSKVGSDIVTRAGGPNDPPAGKPAPKPRPRK